MNLDTAATRAYALSLRAALGETDQAQTEVFVLPPFTSLHEASAAFAGASHRNCPQGQLPQQTQKWFAFRFKGDESEFYSWEWKDMAVLPRLIVQFKKHVYDEVVLVIDHLAGTRA